MERSRQEEEMKEEGVSQDALRHEQDEKHHPESH